MAEENTKRYMELQMEELKAEYAVAPQKEKTSKKKISVQDQKNIELAKLYEDAAEYEKDLEGFEAELEIIKANELDDIAAALDKERPDEERNYTQELKVVLEAGWKNKVENLQTHPQEQLALIQDSDFCDVVEKFNNAFADYDGDFEDEVKDVLVKRWEILIAIKKEHIKEEETELKIAGLKPSFVKRIYKQVQSMNLQA
jgi:hypothetical protein